MANETLQRVSESRLTEDDAHERIACLEQRIASLEALLTRQANTPATSFLTVNESTPTSGEYGPATLVVDERDTSANGVVSADEALSSPRAPRTTRRRTLLKTAGIAAAAVLAAGAAEATQRGSVAHAGSPSPILGGTTNIETAPTYIVSSSGIPTGDSLLNVDNSIPGGNGFVAYGGVGGIALAAGASGGIDIYSGGSGRIQQTTQSFTGAPTSGTYYQGEQIRDAKGDLYICVAGGSPGTWKKVAALNTAYPGGAVAFLSTPVRVYDSRQTGQPLVGHMARNVQVTGVANNGVSVPAGALGAIGNLTVTNTTSGGFLELFPQGGPTPSTSAINFVTGQTVANGFSVGLSASGQVTVESFISGQCDFIVDITGFVA